MKENVPDPTIFRPLKVATPPLAVTGIVPASVPEPEMTLRASVTCPVKLMPRLLLPSVAVTTGCVVNACPEGVGLEGWVVKFNRVGTA